MYGWPVWASFRWRTQFSVFYLFLFSFFLWRKLIHSLPRMPTKVWPAIILEYRILIFLRWPVHISTLPTDPSPVPLNFPLPWEVAPRLVDFSWPHGYPTKQHGGGIPHAFAPFGCPLSVFQRRRDKDPAEDILSQWCFHIHETVNFKKYAQNADK